MKKNQKKQSLFTTLGFSPKWCVFIVFILLLSGSILGLLVKNNGPVTKKIPTYMLAKENKVNEVELLPPEADNTATLTEVVNTEQKVDEEEGIITPMTTLFDENKLPVIGKITGPVVALVIDDMGVDLIHTQQMLKLNDII